MLKAFNVPVQNRFAQLDSDAESELTKTKKSSTPEISPAPPSSPSGTNQQHRETQSVPQDSRSRQQEPRPSRGGRVDQDRPGARYDQDRPIRGGSLGGGGAPRGRGFRGGRTAPRMSTGEAPSPNEDEVLDVDERRDTRTAQRGNRRFDRGGRGGAFRGREYERRSGTGRGREMKKSGAGVYNWGNNELSEGPTAPVEESEGIGELPISVPISGSETPMEGRTVEGPSASETEKPKEESEEDKYVDFSEWQKTQKQKRALLLQEKLAAGGHLGPARSVDPGELERDGYHLYEREETPEERQAREMRMNHGTKMTESEDEEDAHRPRTYNIFQFTGDYVRRGSRGGRGGRGSRGDRGGRDREERRPPGPQQQQPIVLDLGDKAAFPSLG